LRDCRDERHRSHQEEKECVSPSPHYCLPEHDNSSGNWALSK
jgi:hypothetical protein